MRFTVSYISYVFKEDSTWENKALKRLQLGERRDAGRRRCGGGGVDRQIAGSYFEFSAGALDVIRTGLRG